MSLHFRRIVSIILLEYISQHQHININSITLEEFENFILSLRKPRGNIAQCVRNILEIICGNSDVTEAAQNLIATWIRRINTLTSTLFVESKMDIRDRPLESKNVYPNYKIKIKYWYLLGDRLQPKKPTITEIKLLMEMYGFPKNPSDTKWSYVDINFKELPSTSPHVEQEAEQSSTQGESSMIDNVPHVEQEAEQSSTQGESSKTDNVPHVEQEAEQSSTQGESSKIDNVYYKQLQALLSCTITNVFNAITIQSYQFFQSATHTSFYSWNGYYCCF
ncbi:hypothetical protein QTP88_000919 [Uroleucon formosanum]